MCMHACIYARKSESSGSDLYRNTNVCVCTLVYMCVYTYGSRKFESLDADE